MSNLNSTVEDAADADSVLEDLVDLHDCRVRLLRSTVRHVVYVQYDIRHPSLSNYKANPKSLTLTSSFLLDSRRKLLRLLPPTTAAAATPIFFFFFFLCRKKRNDSLSLWLSRNQTCLEINQFFVSQSHDFFERNLQRELSTRRKSSRSTSPPWIAGGRLDFAGEPYRNFVELGSFLFYRLFSFCAKIFWSEIPLFSFSSACLLDSKMDHNGFTDEKAESRVYVGNLDLRITE
ncbi:hypothetical protein LINPERPRIM_LOCUS12841 [Linum perenne]